MVLLRQKLKYFIFIVFAAMLAMQYMVAEHDQLHHEFSGDCMVCKIAQNAHDNNANIVKEPLPVIIQTITLYTFVFAIVIPSFVWTASPTRAPPAS